MNIRNILLTRQGMCTNQMCEGMNDKIGIATGIFSLTKNIGTNFNRMIHQLANHFDEVMPRMIQAPAQIFRITSQRHKADAMFFDEILESRWSRQFDRMTFLHQSQR